MNYWMVQLSLFLTGNLQEEAEAKVDPFDKLSKFLNDTIVDGMLSIVTPIAVLAFMGIGIAALMATDEHARSKFKSGLWWTGAATAICFLAQFIVPWLQKSLGG